MSVRDLIVQAPALCGSAHAEKHAKVAAIVWDHESEKKGFQRVDGETAAERIGFLFDWECEDKAKRDYCMHLGVLTVLAHYANEHADLEAGVEADKLKATLEPQESLYPDVSKVMTVAQAAGGWWGE